MGYCFYSIQQFTAFFTQAFNLPIPVVAFASGMGQDSAGLFFCFFAGSCDVVVGLDFGVSPLNIPIFNPQNMQYNPYD